jgi:hypothetical protein
MGNAKDLNFHLTFSQAVQLDFLGAVIWLYTSFTLNQSAN